MTFGPVPGGEITSGIRLFLADSTDADALSADVNMARCCIDCEFKPLDNLSGDEAWGLLDSWIDSEVDLVLYKIP